MYFPDLPDATGKLTLSHYVEIFGVSKPLARSFYEKQCIIENWSIRELKRIGDVYFNSLNSIVRPVIDFQEDLEVRGFRPSVTLSVQSF